MTNSPLGGGGKASLKMLPPAASVVKAVTEELKLPAPHQKLYFSLSFRQCQPNIVFIKWTPVTDLWHGGTSWAIQRGSKGNFFYPLKVFVTPELKLKVKLQ